MSAKKQPPTNEDIFDQTTAPESDVTAIDRELNNVQPDDADQSARVQAATQEYGGIDFAKAAAQVLAAADQPVDDANIGDGDFFIDMTKADEKLQPMAIGTRLVVSCSGAEAKISGSGNPMIVLRVKVERVVSTPNASTDTSAYKNRTVRDNLLFIPPNPDTAYRGTIWRANQAIRAFGVEPDRGVYRTKAAFMAMLQDKAEELVGAICEVELGIDDGTSGGTKAPAIDPATEEAYPPKNTITRYYPYKPASFIATERDDDLPF